MSFPSCIKIPTSKNKAVTETSGNSNNSTNEKSITDEQLISMGNKVFGHGQWSHSISSQTIDFVDYFMGKYLVGCATFVRVERINGTFHEALGYSNTESVLKGSAIISARTSSVAQALKKALLCFSGAVEDTIDERTAEVLQVKEKIPTANQEGIDEALKVEQQIFAKENTERLSSLDEICQLQKSASKQQQSNVSSMCRFSDTSVTVGAVATMIERQEPNRVIGDQNNLPQKDKLSAAMTNAELLRLERKRKQKQKQEEYQKSMKEKLLKLDEKPNPRY